MTIDGAGAGESKTGAADAGPDEAAQQQQPTGNKIRARGRRKGKRKRRRKAAAASTADQTATKTDPIETTDGGVESADGSDETGKSEVEQTDVSAKEDADSASSDSDDAADSDVSDQPDAVPDNETSAESDADEESATKEAESKPETEDPSDSPHDGDTEVADDLGSGEARDVSVDTQDSNSQDSDTENSDTQDSNSQDSDTQDSDTQDSDTQDSDTESTGNDEESSHDEGDLEAASQSESSSSADDATDAEVEPADSLDGAYSTITKDRSSQLGDDDSKTVSSDPDVKDESTQAEQIADADSDAESDDPEQAVGPALTGERIDDLSSLVEAEPNQNDTDEESETAEAETTPPNIDGLFVGAVDQTPETAEAETTPPNIDDLIVDDPDKTPETTEAETTPPNIDDLFADAVDKTEDESPSTDEVASSDPTNDNKSSDTAESTTAVTDTETDTQTDTDAETAETKGESKDAESSGAETSSSSEDDTNVQVIAPTQELQIAEKSSATDSEVDGTPGDAETSAVTDEATSAKTETPPSPSTEAPPTPAETPSDPAPTGQFAPAPKKKSSSTGLRILKWAAVIAIVGYALLVAAWGISVLGQQDKVASGVQIGELDVGGMTRDDVELEIEALDDNLSTDGLEVVVDDVVIDTNPAAMGVEIDESELISDAFEARRGGFVLFRPFTWLGQIGSTETIDIPYLYDSSKAASTTDLAIVPRLESPVEPSFKFVGPNLAVTEGTSGITVDLDEIEELLPSTIDAGTPYEMELDPTTADPTVETEVVEELASEINALTEDPIRIRILSDEIRVEPKTMREWAVLNLDGDNTAWVFDNDAMIADLKPRFPTLGSEDQQARIEVIDDTPTIINASETVICCEDGVDVQLLETLQAAAPQAPEPDEDDPDAEELEAPLRQAIFQPEIVGFDEGVAELESLGIIEQVSTFTTKHPCCANRVKNIQRFAELMQGTIVRPGESLSLNDTVGRRTTEKGFFSDGAIVNGELKQSVGGGVSQYATTFLNASFYSGVDFIEYKSHSRYISRYPEGREATINFPTIDLEIYNDTEFGILVWNEWTDSSITVSFYSTKNAEVTDLPTRTTWNGQCRTVTTPRLVEYLDDKPDKEDEVFGFYFPGFNKRCDGSLINPPDEDDD